MRNRSMVGASWAVLLLLQATSFPPARAAEAPVAQPQPPVAQVVAPGVWWIAGGVRPAREPDGNSVVFRAPAGLVVVDTGRHSWQREAILALASRERQPIVAIVNTHWHLDHVSGNPSLRAANPAARVYATDAIDGALAGFLARSAQDSAQYLDDPQLPATLREDIRGDVATIKDGGALKPDVVVDRSGPLQIAGLELHVHRAADAVTAGDLWLYDEVTRVAVLGDLVTLPAPFLDTACPDGWTAALDEIARVPFEVAVPGHGAPMKRAQFDLYRHAFAAFLACAGGKQPTEACASQWAEAIASLLTPGDGDRVRAQRLAEYYVGMLRENGGMSRDCRQQPRDERRPATGG